MRTVIAQFLPVLLEGFVVNLTIAAVVVVIAVALGVPLALMRHGGRRLRLAVGTMIRLMQSAPTYVVMFFVLILLPRELSILGMPATGFVAVVLAQAVYLTAYVADDANEAIFHLRGGRRERALLFLPNLLRGFVVVTMSSGYGAAVGVSEAVSATLRQAERLPALGDRILLFAVAIGFFAVIVGLLNYAIGTAIRSLSRPKPSQAISPEKS
jgi:hypothetical protein